MSTYLTNTGMPRFSRRNRNLFGRKAGNPPQTQETRCPKCESKDIALEILCERDERGLPMGLIREVHLIYTLHRIYCHRCHERSIEPISFFSHPKACLVFMFERMISGLLEQISIRALANFFHLRWHTVKNLRSGIFYRDLQQLTHRPIKRSELMRFILATGRQTELTS